MHRPGSCSVDSFYHVSEDVILHEMLSAFFSSGEIVLHDVINNVLGNATTAVGNSTKKSNIRNLSSFITYYFI